MQLELAEMANTSRRVVLRRGSGGQRCSGVIYLEGEYMKLEEKLVLLRKQRGLTQLELAEKINVFRQAVLRWESGETTPSRENLKASSSLYCVTIDSLLNGDEQGVERVERQEKSGVLRKRSMLIVILAIAAVLGIGRAFRMTMTVITMCLWTAIMGLIVF